MGQEGDDGDRGDRGDKQGFEGRDTAAEIFCTSENFMIAVSRQHFSSC